MNTNYDQERGSVSGKPKLGRKVDGLTPVKRIGLIEEVWLCGGLVILGSWSSIS